MKNLPFLFCRLLMALSAFWNACFRKIRTRHGQRLILASSSFYERYIYAYCYLSCQSPFSKWMLTGEGSDSKFLPYGKNLIVNSQILQFTGSKFENNDNPNRASLRTRGSFRTADTVTNIEVEPIDVDIECEPLVVEVTSTDTPVHEAKDLIGNLTVVKND